MTKVQASKTWLFWTGLLLLGLVLVVMVASGSETSRALAPSNGVEIGKTINVVSTEPGQAPVPLYTVIFTNSTGSQVVLDAITDTLPAGFDFVGMHALTEWPEEPTDAEEPEIVWSGPIPIPDGETLSLVYSVDTFGAAPNTTPYVNTVEAVTDGGTPIGPTSAKIWLGKIDLDVEKTASPMRVEGGEMVTYTVIFANSGHLTGTIDVISDTIDPSLDFQHMAVGSDVGGPLDPDASPLVWQGPFEVLPLGELTMRYVVQAPDTATWVYPDNLVKADAQYKMLGPTGVRITVGPETAKFYIPSVQRDFRHAHLVFSKGASPETVMTNDGVDVIYTVTIQNVGDTIGKLSGVQDTLPAGFEYQQMEPGSDVTDEPAVAGQQLTWSLVTPLAIPPGAQKLVIYRVSHSDSEGEYTNSVTISAEEATVQEEPAQATVTVERGILLEDHFDSSIAQWTPFLNLPGRLAEGQWYWGANDGYGSTGGATQDCYAVDGKEAEDALLMYLAPDAEDWGDYRLEAKIILRTDHYPQGFWLRGHYKDVGEEDRGGWVTGYYVMIGGKEGGATHYVSLKQLQTLTDCWGAACDNPENLYDFNNPHELTITKKDGSLARHQWHTVVVEICGDTISVWLNGVLYIDHYVDVKEPFLTGTVGLKTFLADTVTYDDVVVTPITCNP